MTYPQVPAYYVLDEQDQPRVEPDRDAWLVWFDANRTRCRVGFDELANGTVVSTCFLGMSLSPGPDVALWETLVFLSGGSDSVRSRRNYMTRVAAVTGHDETLKLEREQQQQEEWERSRSRARTLAGVEQ